MERVEVYRSRGWRVAAAVAGLLLLIAGVIFVGPGGFSVGTREIMTGPERDANGNYTLRGQTERRADLVLGIPFIAAGAVLCGAALAGSRRRTPVAAVSGEGLELWIRGPRRDPHTFAWDEVRRVHTGWDDSDAGRVRVLIVDVTETSQLPVELWGARRVDDRLVIDATGWNPPAIVVADYAALILHTGAPPAD
jgi:hypothetical protein